MGETSSFGKYRLIAELGHGGMADVFLAVQAGPVGSGFSKLTVIKRLRRNLAEEPEFVSMLVDEARIAARLNHPNVVQTNEVGEVDQQYFIAMEYLDGQPFHRIQHRATTMRTKGEPVSLTKEQQYVIVMDALAGMHHAHELKDYDGSDLRIVHRDITPHNIFITYEGQVKVVDFGIAKAAGRTSETRQGVVKGKVRYMAPEQAIGHDVDRRADVFAAGVILWEIAAGRRMWKDMDDLQIVQALVTNNIPPSPRAIDPSVPEGLDKICQKALRPKIDERYASAEEFRLDLEQFLVESGHLLPARRKLAASVNELFADKRAEIRRVIEQQLSLLNQSPHPSMETRALIQEPPSSATPISVSVEEGAPGLTDQKTKVYTSPKDEPAIKPRGGQRTAFVAAGVAAIVCAAGLLAWRGGHRDTPANPGPIVPETVSLHVTGNAPNEMVALDDGPVQPLPLQIKQTRDDRDHVLRFEAAGYQPQTRVVRFNADLLMAVDLVPVPPPPPVAQTAKPTPPEKPPQRTTATWTPPPRTVPTTPKTAEPPPTSAPPPTVPTVSSAKPPDKKPPTGKLGLDTHSPW